MTGAGSERSRLVRWQDPAALAEAFTREGGLSMLRGVVDGSLPPSPMTELLGFSLRQAQEGSVVWTAEPAEEHHNEAGLIHGGLAAALLDTALGTAVLSALPPGTRCAGLQLSVEFLRPLTPDTGRVRCDGRVVRLGSRVAVADAQLCSERSGDVLARASSTFSVMREEPGAK